MDGRTDSGSLRGPRGPKNYSEREIEILEVFVAHCKKVLFYIQRAAAQSGIVTATRLIVLITIFCNAISSTHHLINDLVIFLAKVSHCPLQTFFCYLSKGSEIERLSRLWTNWNTQPTLSFVIPAMIANIEYCCVANCERACVGQLNPPPKKKKKKKT